MDRSLKRGRKLMSLPHRLRSQKQVCGIALLLVAGTLISLAQSAYQPKFKGDPARSESEANALGYMRTVIRAQQQYFKKNDKYAPTLAELVHTGSFTRRMTETNRGDY